MLSDGGNAMVMLSSIGIPGDAFTYPLIKRDNAQDPGSITADTNVIIGTDSGLEGTTQLYYNYIEIELE